MNRPETVTLAWTGASGMPYGLRLLQCLLAAKVRVYLLYSSAAQMVAKQELDLTPAHSNGRSRRAIRRALRRRPWSAHCIRARGLDVACSIRVKPRGRDGDLPVQLGHAGRGRGRPCRQPDRARRRRDAQGAPAAGARSTRDAAFRDTPRKHAQACPRRRGHTSRLLPAFMAIRSPSAIWSISSSPGYSTS